MHIDSCPKQCETCMCTSKYQPLGSHLQRHQNTAWRMSDRWIKTQKAKTCMLIARKQLSGKGWPFCPIFLLHLFTFWKASSLQHLKFIVCHYITDTVLKLNMSYATESSKNWPISATHDAEADQWKPDLDADDLLDLQAAQQDSSKIISSLPREGNRLGYYSTVCLIFNRMIGMCRYYSCRELTGLTAKQELGSSTPVLSSSQIHKA